MREIKFRAWDKKGGHMYYSFPIVSHGEANIFSLSDLIEEWKAGNYILMQFTGLKDKNGKEIYEGDIIRGTIIYDFWPDEIGVVCFGSFEADSSGAEYSPVECLGFYIDIKKSKDISAYNGGFNCHQELEVIGNVYENPELIMEK